MDFSIDVFDWMAANAKHIFVSFKEGDRAAVMPDTDARRTRTRVRGQAGPGAAVPGPWAFCSQRCFLFLAIACLCSSDGFDSQVIVVSALEGFKLFYGLIGFVVHEGRIIFVRPCPSRLACAKEEEAAGRS